MRIIFILRNAPEKSAPHHGGLYAKKAFFYGQNYGVGA